MRKSWFAVVVVLAWTGLASAHDFWLASSPWTATPGATVTITANVGERFPVADSLTAADRVASLTVIGPGGEVIRASGFRAVQKSLAAEVKLPGAPGTYMAVMVIKPRFIEIPAKDFTAYLTHEGLERVIRDRERLGEGDNPGRERYSRYAKVLMAAGEGPAAHVTRSVNLKAELVPLVDPTRLRIGDRLTLRLLAEGRPVAGALVGGIYASSKGAPDEWPLEARTDEQGEATFVLDWPGPWLFRSVHMIRRDGETGPEAVDWESYWASLTFNPRS